MTEKEQKADQPADIIGTERLLIVALTPEQLLAWCKNPASVEKELNCSYDAGETEDFFRKIIQGQAKKAKKDRGNYLWHTFWWIVRKSDRAVVGSIDFKAPPDGKGEVEIGYGLGKKHEGNGYMTETVRAFCDWAKKNGARHVIAETEIGNYASQRVLLRCGFEEYEHTRTLWWRN